MFERRIEKLVKTLKERDINVALIMQNADLYYFTGSVFQGGLIVTANGNIEMLVIKPWSRVETESPVHPKVKIKSPKQLPEFIKKHLSSDSDVLGMETDVIPWGVVEKIKKYSGVHRIKDISLSIRKIRSIKESFEITQIENAGKILAETFEKIPEFVNPPYTELELAGDIEGFMRKRGHQGYIRVRRYNLELYYGALGVGKSVCSPTMFDGPVGTPGLYAAAPYFAGKSQINSGDILMVDIMAGVEGYLCDATRTYSVGAKPSDFILQAHEIALNIQENIRQQLKPGEIPENIYNDAVNTAKESGLLDNFMGYEENRVKFTGHGLGLEIDEFPVLAPGFTAPLKMGNVMAVEPKFFFGETATGIENTFEITENGGRKLIPFDDEIIVI